MPTAKTCIEQLFDGWTASSAAATLPIPVPVKGCVRQSQKLRWRRREKKQSRKKKKKRKTKHGRQYYCWCWCLSRGLQQSWFGVIWSGWERELRKRKREGGRKCARRSGTDCTTTSDPFPSAFPFSCTVQKEQRCWGNRARSGGDAQQRKTRRKASLATWALHWSRAWWGIERLDKWM